MDEGYFKFRWRLYKRRAIRDSRKFAEVSRHFGQRHILRRSDNLRSVQRFVVGWLGIFIIALFGLFNQLKGLDEYYLVASGESGGVVTEGVIGDIPIINPIYPENQATRAANKLIFNGLTQYDSQGDIAPDLAESWQIDAEGKNYTVKLRSNVLWHDGERFTSADVAYTFRTIQNQSSNSPLFDAWRDVSISTPDEQTVVFSLPTVYAPFLDSLTTGILPAHLLKAAEPSQLRKIDFNQRPVGTGPFVFKDFSLDRSEVRVIVNNKYYKGRPKLDGYILKTFRTPNDLHDAYVSGAITTAAGLRLSDVKDSKDVAANTAQIPTSSQVFAFFNTRNPLLSDAKVRQALVEATSPLEVVERLGLDTNPARSALLPEHIGYNQQITQLPFSIEQAAAKLDAAGWTIGENGFRQKEGQTLGFNLVTLSSDFYPSTANLLQNQWGKLGIKIDVKLVDQQLLQQAYLSTKNYDIILTAVTLGGDPDIYPFWHSAQIDENGLNLSQYSSESADQSLEAGRTRVDEQLRQAKYEAFMSTWREDAPAVALFRVEFYYGLRQSFQGVNVKRLVSPADRFHNVQDWTIAPASKLKRLTPAYEQ